MKKWLERFAKRQHDRPKVLRGHPYGEGYHLLALQRERDLEIYYKQHQGRWRTQKELEQHIFDIAEATNIVTQIYKQETGEEAPLPDFDFWTVSTEEKAEFGNSPLIDEVIAASNRLQFTREKFSHRVGRMAPYHDKFIFTDDDLLSYAAKRSARENDDQHITETNKRPSFAIDPKKID